MLKVFILWSGFGKMFPRFFVKERALRLSWIVHVTQVQRMANRLGRILVDQRVDDHRAKPLHGEAAQILDLGKDFKRLMNHYFLSD